MMLLLVVLCGLVAATVGQEEARAGCCAPRQWEAQVNNEFSVNPPFAESRLVLYGIRLAYDALHGKMRQDVRFYLQGDQPALTFIYDFTQRKAYRIDPETKSCKSYSISYGMAKLCIPRTAQEFGTVYYGVGRSRFAVNAYGFTLPRQGKYVGAQVSQKGCLPVEDVSYGGYKFGYYLGNVGYSNITAGIQDPSVFDTPAFCKHTGMPFEDLDEPPMNSFLMQHLNSRLME